eukprot:scaffold21173_cov89-Isochrysis_galbana.AAC.2
MDFVHYFSPFDRVGGKGARRPKGSAVQRYHGHAMANNKLALSKRSRNLPTVKAKIKHRRRARTANCANPSHTSHKHKHKRRNPAAQHVGNSISMLTRQPSTE